MDAFYPVAGFSRSSFRNGIVIVPLVSLANLPQLAADLLITTLGLKRVGWVGRGDTVVPFAGAGENGEDIVTGGLEVYGTSNSDIFVVQQRSPTLKSRKDDHISLLHSFLISNDFAFILILASLDAASQDDAQLLTPHQHILPPPSYQSTSKHIERLKELVPPLSLQLSETPTPSSSLKPYPPFLPAAGLTRRLLSSLNSSGSPSHGAITAWCVEGDNRGDAHAFAQAVLTILEMDTEVKEPNSWAGLFGAREGWSGGTGDNAELYG